MRVVALRAGHEKGMPKERAARLFLRAGYGAVGDCHAGGDPNRALLLVGTESYRVAGASGAAVPDGGLGENVLFDFDPHALPAGARLRLGEALVELGAPCPACARLAEIGAELPALLRGRRGVYGRVLENGWVEEGSGVNCLVEPSVAASK